MVLVAGGPMARTSDLLRVVSQTGGNVLTTLRHGDHDVLAADSVRAAGLGGQLAAQYGITLVLLWRMSVMVVMSGA